MTDNFNIVHLIEKNPLTRLTKKYQSNFVERIKENFNEDEQHLFAASFYCYLNHDAKKDFVVDLDDVWKWLGFARKDHCKRLLEKHFTKDNCYKILIPPNGGAKSHGGSVKESILMNVNTFKKLCLKAGTKKADEIHDYFLKLEETLHAVLKEESEELREQLEENRKELTKEKSLRNKMLNRRWYDAENGEYLYLFVDDTNNVNSPVKVGKSKNIVEREVFYSKLQLNLNKSGSIIYIQKCKDCNLAEKVCHYLLDQYRINKMQEFFSVSRDIAKTTIQESIAFLDRTEITEEDTQYPLEKEQQKIEEDAPQSRNIEDFITSCCVLGDDKFVLKEELKQAYRIWAKSVDMKTKKEFCEFIDKNYKVTKRTDGKQKRLFYSGLELRPLKSLVDLGNEFEHLDFINTQCRIDWSCRSTYIDIYDCFTKWKRNLCGDETYKIDPKTKKCLQKYIESKFYGGRVHVSKTTEATHLYGIWGLSVNEDTGLKQKKRTAKQTIQINAATKEIIQTWESALEASTSLGIANSTLSNYIRFGTTQICPSTNMEVIYKYGI
jgi:hypothetical protein